MTTAQPLKAFGARLFRASQEIDDPGCPPAVWCAVALDCIVYCRAGKLDRRKAFAFADSVS